MSLSYLDIATLKTERADLNKSLRWVESVLAWYQSDPLSTATGDNDTVIVPDTGVGRWLKQNSRANVVQGLTSQILTTSTTVSAGTKNYCDTTSGALTITLPASPPTGSLVSIFALAGTSLINKITLNPNGANINGVSGNREITVLQDFIDLEFVTGSGWVIKGQTNTSVLKTPTTAYTVAPPLLSATPSYTGIVNYLGRQKNTTTYINPSTSSSGTRTVRLQVASDANGQAGGLIQANSALFTGGANTLDCYLYYNQANTYAPCIIVDFTSGGSARISTIQYSMTNTNNRYTDSRPKYFKVWGANTVDLALFGVNTIQPSLQVQSSFSDTKQLFVTSTMEIASQWQLTGSTYHTLLNINSANFYRYYILQANYINIGNINSNYLFVNQLEFFGDVVAV